MHAKLENNILKYAPHYLICNGKTILNPQDGDYKAAGYKEVEYSKPPQIQYNKELATSYIEEEDKIKIVYSLTDKLATPEQREAEFYKNFIQTSWGNFRKIPQGYSSAVEAVNTIFNMVNIQNGLTEQLAPLLIFYPTPDFSKIEQCNETWLIENQYTHAPCTKEEFLQWYNEFQAIWAQTQYTDIPINT